jgi:peptidoglycan/LPS O-acetylase OafA/YrhL
MQGFGFKDFTTISVGTPLTFLVVLLSYYFMERPILQLKKRFTPGSLPKAAVLQAGEQSRIDSLLLRCSGGLERKQ